MPDRNLTQIELDELDEIFARAVEEAFEQVVLLAALEAGDTVDNLNKWTQQNGANIKTKFGIETVEATNRFIHDQLMAAAKRLQSQGDSEEKKGRIE